MHDSDSYLQQSERMASRERKWEYHRKIIENEMGIRCQKKFPESVLEMGELLSPVPSSKWAELQHVLFPHRWITGARRSGQNLKQAFLGISPELLEIARGQIHWEIWGLLGQVRLRRNSEDVKQHLIHLTQLFPERDPLHSSLKEFLAYLEGQRS
jgi:hypothetical protein